MILKGIPFDFVGGSVGLLKKFKARAAGGGDKQRPSRWKLAIAHAERLHCTWVNPLGRGSASDVHRSTGKPEPAFQSAESDLSLKDRTRKGHASFEFGRILVCILG